MAAVGGGAGGGLAAVVPTIGASPHLERCLGALRRERVETVVVHQGPGEPPPPARLADRLLRLPANLGFAAATDHGIAATAGELVATVNDDAVVEPGWAAALAEALDAEPRAAAAQGSNLRLDDPGRLDGRGLAWNRWWQAVQLGHGEPVPEAPSPAAVEVFGVSATAAVYRRRALEAVATAGGAIFDPRLGAYYEDADLACRLRRAGWTALWVPAARALHAGSVTGDRRRRWRLSRIYGNRWPVVARCLGRRLPLAVPRMAARDLADFALALGRADLAAAAGVASGWARAARLLPGAIHRGPAVAVEPE